MKKKFKTKVKRFKIKNLNVIHVFYSLCIMFPWGVFFRFSFLSFIPPFSLPLPSSSFSPLRYHLSISLDFFSGVGHFRSRIAKRVEESGYFFLFFFPFLFLFFLFFFPLMGEGRVGQRGARRSVAGWVEGGGIALLLCNSNSSRGEKEKQI